MSNSLLQWKRKLIIITHTSKSNEDPTRPEDSKKLRFSHYLTIAQNDGKVVSLTHRPFLPPGNTPGTHLC